MSEKTAVNWTPSHKSYHSAGDEAEAYCENCGEFLEEDSNWNYCPFCGLELDWEYYRNPQEGKPQIIDVLKWLEEK